MKLNLKTAFASIFRLGKPEEDNLPVSMVLLLREPRFLTLDELRAAAERGFGVPFNGGKNSRHFVMQAASSVFVKAGPHMVNLLNYTKPYGEEDFPKDFATSLPHESQQRAWSEHKSWTAVDYVKGGADLEREYAVLAKLCAEMLNGNCSGLYVPREQNLIPNDQSLRGELLRIAASRPLDVS